MNPDHLEILDKWRELGGKKSFLGAFKGKGQSGSCPDGFGAYAHFDAGSIHWHPDSGAHATRGPIRDAWEERGWEQGPLGYPVSDPFRPSPHEWTLAWAGGGRERPLEIVRFERGVILHFEDGRTEVRDQAEDAAGRVLLPLVEAGYASPRLRGELLAPPAALPLIPGCADLQLAQVRRLGHRGRFPQPHDWENLLPMLEAGEELLWIVTKHEGAFACYLGYKVNRDGVGDRGEAERRRDRFRNLLSQFAWRSFPESQVEELTAEEVCAVAGQAWNLAGNHVTVVSGLPSAKNLEEDRQFTERDREAELHVSLNDVLEPFFDDDAFCIVTTLGRADERDVRDRIDLLSAARTAVAPAVRRQVAASESEQSGKQRSSTATKTEGVSQQERRNAVVSFFQSLNGATAHTIKRTRAAASAAQTEHAALPDASTPPTLPEAPGWRWLEKLRAPVRFVMDTPSVRFVRDAPPVRFIQDAPLAYQHGTSMAVGEVTSTGHQSGVSFTHTELDAGLELLDHAFEGSIKLLRTGAATGAFYAAACIYARERDLGGRIGRSVAAKLAGARSHLRPFQVVSYQGPGACSHLTHNAAAHQLFPGLTLLNSHFAARMLLTPENELPGLRLKRNVFYGRPERADAPAIAGSEPRVRLGKAAFFGGNVRWSNDYPHRQGNREQTEFSISGRELLSHLLITGTTGSGKTVRAVDILNELPVEEFQVIVIESAKKTFRGKFGRSGRGVRVFTLGESRENPLRINPLFCEPGTSLKHHISILSDAMADLLPAEAMIPEHLREAVQRAYLDAGWNIEQARCENGEARHPGVLDLYAQVLEVANGLEYDRELKQNYLGALTTRTRLFIDALYQDIFAWGGNRSLDELFGEDDAVIEMDALPPSEINMPGFILSLLLQRMRARQMAAGRTGRKQIIVIEEAHNLLHRRHEAEKSALEAGGGKNLIQQIVRLLQEGRELGIGVVVIDQSPANLADAVLKNTNTKLVHRIIDSSEARLVGSCLGLGDEDWRDLHELETGECIVQSPRAGKPVKLAPAFDPERRPRRDTPRPEVPVATPPDYARAARLLEEACREPFPAAEAAALADELFAACLGQWELVTYVVRRFLLLDLPGGEPKPDLPATPEELADFLLDLSHGTRLVRAERGRFARQLLDLVNGVEATPSPDSEPANLRWTGPLVRLAEGLGRARGWEDAGMRKLFCERLEQWQYLRGDNAELPDIRRQIREVANANRQRQAGLQRTLDGLAETTPHRPPPAPVNLSPTHD